MRSVRATLVAILCAACAPAPHLVELHGVAMGTNWTIRAVSRDPQALARLRPRIEATFAHLDRIFSTWRSDSELTTLKYAPIDQWRPVSPELVAVLAESRRIWRWSAGAFDPTVAPLLQLWGFGPQATTSLPPDPPALAAVVVDFGQVEFARAPPRVRRRAPVELDLSGIAKGYVIDRLSALLAEHGLADHLVELGGDLRVRGRRPDGTPWRIGVQDPSAPPGTPRWSLALIAGGVATSGDYRNRRRFGDQYLTHVVDPRTRTPVAHGLASVTVVASTAMRADGLATALLVLGPGAGYARATAAGLAALFVVRTPDGWRVHATPKWRGLAATPTTEPAPGDR